MGSLLAFLHRHQRIAIVLGVMVALAVLFAILWLFLSTFTPSPRLALFWLGGAAGMIGIATAPAGKDSSWPAAIGSASLLAFGVVSLIAAAVLS